jgi:hypothetical protein
MGYMTATAPGVSEQVEGSLLGPPNLLADIDERGAKSAWVAAERIIGRAASLELLDRPWSVAELRLSDADYAWLREWARRLSPRDLSSNEAVRASSCSPTLHAMRPPSYAVIGLVMLAFVAECVRRDGEEKQVWRPLLLGPLGAPRFQPDTRALLFTGTAASAEMRALVKAATLHWNMRHAFDRKGSQSWYLSIYLQFGFTRRAIAAQLANWLAGTVPTGSVKSLRGPVKGDDTSEEGYASSTFRALWNTLKRVRSGVLSRADAQALVDESPWTRPEWTSEVLDAAEAGSVAAQGVAREAEVARDWIGLPSIHVNAAGVPHFFAELGLLHRDGDVYTVRVQGAVMRTLVRQPSGAFDPPPGTPIDLGQGPDALVELLDADGVVCDVRTVSLWDHEEDLIAFDGARGRPLDPWGATPLSSSTYVVAAHDLRFEPAAESAPIGRDGHHRFYAMATAVLASTKVYIGDSVLWSAQDWGVHQPSASPWAADIQVRFLPRTELGHESPIEVEFEHGDGVTIRRVRVLGAEPGTSSTSSTRTTTDPLVPANIPRRNQVRVVAWVSRAGEEARIHRMLPTPYRAAAWRRGNEWLPLSGEDIVDAELARDSPMKIHLGPLVNSRDEFNAQVYEGRLPRRRVWKGSQPLGKIGGFGAPITVRIGEASGPSHLHLFRGGVDKGVVRSAEHDQVGGQLRVILAHNVEPSPQHSLVVWTTTGVVRLLSSSSIRVEAAKPVWTVNDINEKIAAIGIAFDGVWLGTHCFDLFTVLCADGAQPAVTACLIRWLRLPVLLKEHREWVYDRVRENPVEMLAGFLVEHPRALPEGLLLGASANSTDWLQAVRELIRPPLGESIRLAHKEAVDVVDALGARAKDRVAATEAGFRLGQLDPRIMERLLVSYLVHDFVAKNGDIKYERITHAFAILTRIATRLAERVDDAAIPDHRWLLEYVDLDEVADDVELTPALTESVTASAPGSSIARLRTTTPVRLWLGITDHVRDGVREHWARVALTLLAYEKTLTDQLKEAGFKKGTRGGRAPLDSWEGRYIGPLAKCVNQARSRLGIKQRRELQAELRGIARPKVRFADSLHRLDDLQPYRKAFETWLGPHVADEDHSSLLAWSDTSDATVSRAQLAWLDEILRSAKPSADLVLEKAEARARQDVFIWNQVLAVSA